ncbi:MAG TPA: dihydroneopterin aldolase [Candidatus Saccharimonadales bacterium]
MPIIYIKDLVAEGKHGVNPSEKQTAQRFRISLELTVDNAAAGQSDDLDDTLDWSGLRHMVIDTVQNNSFNLVERLAQVIADRILADKRVQKLVLSIDKPDAFANGVPGIRLEAGQRQDG